MSEISALSTMARTISASATLQLNAAAARMRAEGEPVIHLGGGEPKSLAPRGALEAGIAMLETGEVRYTPASGIPALKDAVITYTERYCGRRVDRSQVMASAGAKQAIMIALMALVDPGDEVVFPVPYWVSYPEMARIAGGVPVPVACEAGAHQPTLAAMDAALGPRAKVLLLNSPSNPAGKILDREFMTAVIAMCQERGVTVLLDDIYHRLVFDGLEVPHGFDCTAKDVEEAGLVVLNGVSKQYAMTGFRVGWAVGPSHLIKAMANIQSHLSGGPCSVSQVASVAAILGDQAPVDELRIELQARRDETLTLLEAIPGVRPIRPDGTFYCFADFSAIEPDATALSRRLLDQVRVVTVPGIEFGLEGHLRISYCGAMEDVREGIRRIGWLVDPTAGAELTVGDRVFTR